MKTKILVCLGLLILAFGSVLYAEDATPADPNTITDSNGVNDPNITVSE